MEGAVCLQTLREASPGEDGANLHFFFAVFCILLSSLLLIDQCADDRHLE